MNFKLLSISVLALAVLGGCAAKSTAVAPVVYAQVPEQPIGPVYKLRNYAGPEAMETEEVLQASRQCILNKMRPNVSYLSVRTEAGKLRVPVSVQCEPF